jgi:hypothetical protein
MIIAHVSLEYGAAYNRIANPEVKAIIATSSGFLARHFLAFGSRLGEAYRDRLLFTLYSLTAFAALEGASFTTLHGPLHILGCGLGLSSHLFSPSTDPQKTQIS